MRRDFDSDDGRPPADRGGANFLPCRWCRKETLSAILAQYGARCSECYDRYCSEGFAPPPLGRLTRQDKLGIMRRLRAVLADISGNRSPRGWAYALKAREDAGEQLSPAQRAMWRGALQPSRPTVDVSDAEP